MSEREDDWLRRATTAAIAAARKIVFDDAINKNTSLGNLSETEWGWIVAAVICGWVKTRANQAATEGSDVNAIIHVTGQTPDPWEVGALESVLPKLGELALPFDRPMGAWSKQQMISFVGQAHQLVQQAFAARDKAADSQPEPIQSGIGAGNAATAASGLTVSRDGKELRRRWISIGSRIDARLAIALMRRSDRPKREG